MRLDQVPHKDIYPLGTLFWELKQGAPIAFRHAFSVGHPDRKQNKIPAYLRANPAERGPFITPRGVSPASALFNAHNERAIQAAVAARAAAVPANTVRRFLRGTLTTTRHGGIKRLVDNIAAADRDSE
jgi:hypothetical protein